jgi:hypothetical protein
MTIAKAVCGAAGRLAQGVLAIPSRIDYRTALRAVTMAAVVLVGANIAAHASAAGMFSSAMNTSGAPSLLNRGMKIFGGFLAIGGISLTINGFTGRDEGFDKVVKIGVGIITLAMGVYFVTKGSQAFGISQMLDA